MTKLIWMSDLHFVAEGRVQDHDPRVRLRAAINHVNDHHRDAELCVISGDMVDRGTSVDYAAVNEILGRLNVPFYPMVGNHDNRKLFREHLPVPCNGSSEFIQYAVETENAVLLCLDTLESGSDAGTFCSARQDWLVEKLNRYNDRPIILFMHHHPAPLGLPMQDQDRMTDGPKFLSLISGRPNIHHMCIGHVHRPITGVVRGIPFTTMRSVLYQAPAPSPAWDWESFAPSQEAPNLGVILLDGQDLTIQFDQFCTHELGIQFM